MNMLEMKEQCDRRHSDIRQSVKEIKELLEDEMKLKVELNTRFREGWEDVFQSLTRKAAFFFFVAVVWFSALILFGVDIKEAIL